jgi:hypothetical protein
MSKLKNWLKSEGFYNTTETKPSHLLYDGGKIYVPRSKEIDFLKKYAEELKNGSKLYYVETRPKIFRYMIDLDITDKEYWSEEKIIKVCRFIQMVVNEFYDINYSIYVITSPEKKKKEGIHTGIHIIWPNVYINSKMAIILRKAIIQKIYEELEITIEKKWEDIIDEVIYTRNGYRMVGSDKMTMGEDGVKKEENRVLELKYVLNEKSEIDTKQKDKLLDNIEQLILETSIRNVPEYYMYENSNGVEFARIPEWYKETISLEKSTPTTVKTDEYKLMFEEFIRKKFPSAYKNVVVKSVKKYEDGNYLIITNSKYCMNIGRQHNSCGIYFYANKVGVSQKCLCPCNTLEGRKHGYCYKYTSECYEYTDDMIKILHGGRTKIKFNPMENKKSYILEKKKSMCENLLKNI